MTAPPTHQVIERDGVEAPRTIYAAGLYAVSERDLGVYGVEYRVTHTPTGIVIQRPWRAGLACDLADALNDAFGLTGAYLPWGASETLAVGLRTGEPHAAAIIARVLATDNPHGEPPPNPCPTCGHVRETP